MLFVLSDKTKRSDPIEHVNLHLVHSLHEFVSNRIRVARVLKRLAQVEAIPFLKLDLEVFVLFAFIESKLEVLLSYCALVVTQPRCGRVNDVLERATFRITKKPKKLRIAGEPKVRVSEL